MIFVSASKMVLIEKNEVMIVGTRMLSEAAIKQHYPHLKYVRIHTAGRNSVVIYAWNEDLDLPEGDIKSLRRFAAGYLPPYLCCQVKAYSMLRTDGVPKVPALPASVAEAAMDRGLNQSAIVGLINGMLSGGKMTFDGYDDWTGTLHFTVRCEGTVTEIKKELIHQYLHEMIPLGSHCEVVYS
jgi:hypothetical protein